MTGSASTSRPPSTGKATKASGSSEYESDSMRSEASTESSPLPVKGQLFMSRSLWRPKMPLRILLADDHLIVRQGLKSLLEQEQCTVVAEASDGREAIQLAQKLHPDVAVLDLAMPLLNGLEAAREILKVSPE